MNVSENMSGGIRMNYEKIEELQKHGLTELADFIEDIRIKLYEERDLKGGIRTRFELFKPPQGFDFKKLESMSDVLKIECKFDKTDTSYVNTRVRILYGVAVAIPKLQVIWLCDDNYVSEDGVMDEVIRCDFNEYKHCCAESINYYYPITVPTVIEIEKEEWYSYWIEETDKFKDEGCRKDSVLVYTGSQWVEVVISDECKSYIRS